MKSPGIYAINYSNLTFQNIYILSKVYDDDGYMSVYYMTQTYAFSQKELASIMAEKYPDVLTEMVRILSKSDAILYTEGGDKITVTYDPTYYPDEDNYILHRYTIKIYGDSIYTIRCSESNLLDIFIEEISCLVDDFIAALINYYIESEEVVNIY